MRQGIIIKRHFKKPKRMYDIFLRNLQNKWQGYLDAFCYHVIRSFH